LAQFLVRSVTNPAVQFSRLTVNITHPNLNRLAQKKAAQAA
jgi:hypothetical protein